jgi:hypothetical protein
MFQEVNEWLTKRCGKITSSEVYKIMTVGRKETFSQTAKSYLKLKAAELLTGEPFDRPTTYAMEWGNSHEFEAIQTLQNHLEKEVEYFGGGNPKFYEKSKFWGGSPDGFLDDVVVEVKCPFNSSEHLEHLLFKTQEDLKDYAPEYYWQILSNMLLTGKEKGMFVSYDPRYPDSHKLKVLDIYFDKSDAKLLEERILLASKELELILSNFK